MMSTISDASSNKDITSTGEGSVTTAIILAAGMGRRLNLPDRLPKNLVEIGGRTLLGWQTGAFASVGVQRIVVVVGHESDRVIAHTERLAARYGLEAAFVENPRFAETNTLHSLYLARHFMDGAFYLANGDLLLRPSLVQALAKSRHDTAFAIAPQDCGDEEVKVITDDDGRIRHIGKDLDPAVSLGESVGVVKIGSKGHDPFAEALRHGAETLKQNNAYYESAFDAIAEQVPLHCEVLENEPVLEIDFPDDLHTARTDVVRRMADEKTSSMQKNIQRDHDMLPGSHTLRMAVQVETALDRAALNRACAYVMERHPLLRQAFVDVGEGRRAPAHHALLPNVVEADGLDETELRALIAEESARDFHPSREPLVRVSAFTRGDAGYVLQIHLHHLVYDLSSAHMYFEDLLSALGGEDPAGDPGESYDLFVRREAKYQQALEADGADQFWPEQLNGTQPGLPFGNEVSLKTAAVMEGVSFNLDPETTAELERRRVPLHAACLSAYASALNAIFDVDDLLVGTTVTLRLNKRLRNLDGPVFNYIPLRLQPRADVSAAEALERTAAMWRSMWSMRWYPFSRVLDQFEDRPPVHLGLTQNFNYYDVDRLGHSRIGGMRAGTPATYGDLEMRNFPLHDDAVVRPYLLNMSALVAHGRTSLGLKYRTGLIEHSAAKQVLKETAANMCSLADELS